MRSKGTIRILRPAVLLLAAFLLAAGDVSGERIGSIRIEGNQAFPGDRALEALDLAPGGEWSAREESVAVLRLLDRYARAGYLEAEASVRVFSAPGGAVDLELTIREGPFLPLVRVDIEGTRALPVEEIRGRIDTRPGRVLNAARLEEDLDRTLRRYASSGYPFARILTSRVERSGDPEGIALRLQVVEGPFLTLGDIRVTGNRSTRASVIRRLSGLRFGEPYDQDAVEAGRDRLLRSGLFRTVSDPTTRVEWKEKEAVVEYAVEEGRHNRITGVVGYAPGPNGGDAVISGFVDLSFRNILGTARSAEIRWERVTPETRHARIAYREPWVLGTPFSLGGEMAQVLRDSTYSRFTGDLTSDVELSRRVRADFRFGGETMRPRREAAPVPRSRRAWGGIGFSYEGRDYPANPTGGWKARLGGEYAERRIDEEPERGFEGKRVRQATLDAAVGLYHRVGRRGVLAWEGEGIGRYTNASYVPAYDQFYLGGATTLRGYDEDRFLGERIAWSRLEARVLLGPLSRAFLFFDSGWVFRRFEEGDSIAHSTIVRHGYGFGIRVDSAIGLLGVDFGIGQGDGFSDAKIHVSAEGTF
ncbi:MAG: BamA/TamA family outer membrane protein [Candidatus Eisenbacteria bacterium]|nr:BamA/TamA family outer membrane protein [Candidatus Eisenbacteria bacterium]